MKQRWRAELGEQYFYIEKDNKIYGNTEAGCKTDDELWRIGNYYKTREIAEKKVLRDITIIKINDIILEMNEGKLLNWNKTGVKKTVYYDHRKKKFSLRISSFINEESVLQPIEDWEKAQELIQVYRDDLLLIWDIKYENI